MVLSAAFIVPHGALILDANPSHTDGRYELHQAMIQVADKINEIKPDVILVTSPHGISLSSDFGIYINQSAKGSAEWLNEYKEYSVNVPIDIDFSNEVYDYLKKHNQNISKITSFTRSEPIPIRWGEAVPLWFLRDISNVKYGFISQPQKRYEPTPNFADEATKFGIHLANFMESKEKRIVVLISADLAHTHQKEGPYGFYEDAEFVDRTLERWTTTPNSSKLSQEVFEQIKKALCCGHTGFLLLQGILSTVKKFESQILTREAPTYYGMMIVSYLQKI